MKHPRKLIRLPQLDYRQDAAYAVTICVAGRREAFGQIRDGEMMLNRFGLIAFKHLASIPEHHSQVILDEFIVMPNHIHAILWLSGELNAESNQEVKREFGKPQSGSLSVVVNSFKAGVTRRISTLRGQKTNVWQPRFHEHIIRNELDLLHQREYIQNNPAKWQDDEMNKQSGFPVHLTPPHYGRSRAGQQFRRV